MSHNACVERDRMAQWESLRQPNRAMSCMCVLPFRNLAAISMRGRWLHLSSKHIIKSSQCPSFNCHLFAWLFHFLFNREMLKPIHCINSRTIPSTISWSARRTNCVNRRWRMKNPFYVIIIIIAGVWSSLSSRVTSGMEMGTYRRPMDLQLPLYFIIIEINHDCDVNRFITPFTVNRIGFAGN